MPEYQSVGSREAVEKLLAEKAEKREAERLQAASAEKDRPKD